MITIFELGIINGRANHVLPGLGSETYLLPCQLLKLIFLTQCYHILPRDSCWLGVLKWSTTGRRSAHKVDGANSNHPSPLNIILATGSSRLLVLFMRAAKLDEETTIQQRDYMRRI